MLAARDFKGLKQHCSVDEDEVREMWQEIRALDSKPGNRFHAGPDPLQPTSESSASPGWVGDRT
ncbi:MULTISPECIES: hypothetical protein [Mesorhizobium]|uniref:RNA polymerase factor sigma-54 n=1 Tax=Mesorhizobium TaxID=68287 RepID=UPI000A044587|nr:MULTISPECIES: hypothetical protein [Mesorhizobium]MCH4561500.1 hypothetical protein [Mesorhizobium jarvisii]QGU21235.1 hypothetical protein MCHK_12440 [Mesorhizobium huakuii 7653R]